VLGNSICIGLLEARNLLTKNSRQSFHWRFTVKDELRLRSSIRSETYTVLTIFNAIIYSEKLNNI